MAENDANLDCVQAGPSISKFAHGSLGGGKAIRLLALQPGGRNDAIKCKILHTSLDADPIKYTALSYAWGSLTLTNQIFINDNTYFQVTKSLHNALQELRSEVETRSYWIDQICINQADNDEKSSQLGESAGEAAKAFRTVRNLDEAITQAMNTDQEIVQEWNPDISDVAAKGLMISSILLEDQSGLYALQNMFCQPWFSRVWIIQEVVLAENVTIQWGAEQLPWETLAETVVRAETFKLLQSLLFKNPETTKARMLISGIRKLKGETDIPRSLFNLLLFSNFQISTDPRDKIFALLGLIKNSSSFGIVPRYDIATYSVFRHATAALILQHKSLRVLFSFFQSPRHRLLGLPSWSVDFSATNLSLIGRPFQGFDLFRADKNHGVEIRWDKDPNLLRLRGRTIDTITDDRICFNPPLSGVDFSDETQLQTSALEYFRRLAVLLSSCRRMWQHAPTQNVSKREGTNNYWSAWRALVGGLQEDTSALADGAYSQYYQDYERYVRHAGTVSAYEDIEKIRDGWSRKRAQGVVAYSRAVLEAGNERQFIVTKSGRLGWVPNWVQTGDQVAIVHGSRMPIVIRACAGDRWTFVSGCYLDGVMFGEALEDDDYQTEDITLC